MVFRTFFNEPRPKGFLEIGEVLDELDIDVDDHDNISITITCDPKTGPKFDETSHGFSAEVIYSGDEQDAQFTTLGYRSLDELKRDLHAADFDVRSAHYDILPDIMGMTFRDDPDESTVSTIESKAADFAELREAMLAPNAILAEIPFVPVMSAEEAEEAQFRVKALGKGLNDMLAFAEKHDSDWQEIPGDRLKSEAIPGRKTIEYTQTKENPDMAFKHEIFILANTLTAAVHRAQTELLEVNRLALAITDKIGQSAFSEDTIHTTTSELVLTLDASPLTEALEELAQRVSTGLDADAQSAVESSGYVETKEIIEDAANKATEAAVKQVEPAVEQVMPSSSPDFDAAVEDALAKGVETALAVEVPAEAPQPLPKASSVPNVGQTPAVAAEPLDQSDDAKDFRAIASYFLNTYTGARDCLLVEANIFNATWDHAGRKIVPNLSKHLIKVPNSKMIWTQRLNSLFKKNIGTTVDAVLYGSTNPVSMQLVRDSGLSYSFIKV